MGTIETEIDLLGMARAERVDAFLEASVGNGARAARMLADDPGLATYDFRTSVVLGDAARVDQLLSNQPELAHRPDPRSGWPPLLGACSSRWHQIDPARGAGLLQVARMLLDAGADPDGPGLSGRSPYRSAVVHGRHELLPMLARHGAQDDSSDIDAALRALATADRAEIGRLLGADPGLPDRFTAADQAILCRAAFRGDTEVVRLMLDVGFPVELRCADDDGATVLHLAAASGSDQVVRLLLERGADLEATDTTWKSTPLIWASVGSGQHLGHNPAPDWVATVQTLLGAGAGTRDARPRLDKAPSNEVAALLLAHGIYPLDDDDVRGLRVDTAGPELLGE